MTSTSAQKTITSVVLVNHIIGVLYNAALFYSFVKGNVLHMKRNHDYFSFILVISMWLCSFFSFIVDIFLLVFDKAIDEMPAEVCNLSGINCIFGAGIMMTCLLFYAVDRYFKIGEKFGMFLE